MTDTLPMKNITLNSCGDSDLSPRPPPVPVVHVEPVAGCTTTEESYDNDATAQHNEEEDDTTPSIAAFTDDESSFEDGDNNNCGWEDVADDDASVVPPPPSSPSCQIEFDVDIVSDRKLNDSQMMRRSLRQVRGADYNDDDDSLVMNRRGRAVNTRQPSWSDSVLEIMGDDESCIEVPMKA